MIPFEAIEYLKQGNERQMRVYEVLTELRIMEELFLFKPILCGTIPIGLDVEQSDLDIVMKVSNFPFFERILHDLFGQKESFQLQHKRIRGEKICKANFFYKGFEFELFGQAKPAIKQNAYLHMIVESNIIRDQPSLKEKVIHLKKQGVKTEPAFCQVLQLTTDDPYERLLSYGVEKGYISR